MWNYLPGAVQYCFERLKNAQIECTDAVELIKRYSSKETLIYCDPPYLQDLRKRYLYHKEMSDEEHKQLLEVLLESKSNIILSGYDNELYNNMLQGWNTDTTVANIQFGKKRIEKIWFNFDNPNYYYTLI